MKEINEKVLFDFLKSRLEKYNNLELSYKAFVKDDRDSIEICVNGDCLCTIDDYKLSSFLKNLYYSYDMLKELNKNLNIVTKDKEFHYRHYGYNSCKTEKVVTGITTQKVVEKAGIVKEKHKLVGKKELEEVLSKYPNYELYLRMGFRFRGAEERLVNVEQLRKDVSYSAACDIEVIDDEIHVNTFSCNDLY